MMKQDEAPLALLYVRRSTDEQPTSLAVQEHKLIAVAEARGYRWQVVVEDAKSAATIKKRPALLNALELLDSGKAHLLMVSELTRVSRTLMDFCRLLDQSKRKGWKLICLDVQVDTSTPAGEFMAHIIASVSQYERGQISVRTKEALAQLKREGKVLGRPNLVSEGVRQRALLAREQGASLAQIADTFTAEQVPTGHAGARWYPSTISKLLVRQN